MTTIVRRPDARPLGADDLRAAREASAAFAWFPFVTSIPVPLARPALAAARHRLSLDEGAFLRLFSAFGPSLGLWRAAEIASLRACAFARPILDLGCGDGVVTSFVLGRVEVGLDPWETALVRAAALGVYDRLEQATIEAAPLAAESVATIISNSVLEHLANIDEALRAAARLLVPGGRLVFTVPTEAFGRWLLVPSAAYGRWRNAAYDHRNVWTLQEWDRRLRGAGFEIEETSAYLRRPLVALWDALELTQRVWVGQRRVAGAVWKSVPARAIGLLARLASRLDLSSPPPGGGRLIVARRVPASTNR